MAVIPHAQFSLFAGASGAGKTTLLLQSWLEHELHPGHFPISYDPRIKSAGIIIADRTKSEAEARIATLGIKNLEVYGIVDDHALATDCIRRPDLLTKHVLPKFKEKHDLYFIDPIGLFMEGSLIDYKSVASSLIGLNRIASRLDATLLGVHHTTKPRSDVKFSRPQDRVSGSGAFPGYSSTQIMLIEGLETQATFDSLIIVPHMTPKEEYRLVRREDGYFALLEEQARGLLTTLFESFNKFMKLGEFKSLAAKNGLTDSQINQLLEESKDYKVEDGFVLQA